MKCKKCKQFIKECSTPVFQGRSCLFNGYIHIDTNSHYCDMDYPYIERTAEPE